MPSILFLTENAEQTNLIKRAFSTRALDEFRLSFVATLDQARAVIASDPPQLIIADWELSTIHGDQLLLFLTETPAIPIVVMVSPSNAHLADEALQAGAIDYILKTPETLMDSPHLAANALRHWNMLVDKARLENDLRMRVEQDSIWQTVGKTIVSNQTPDQTLSTVIDIIKRKMQVETGTILLWDPDSQRIVFSKILHGDPNQFSSFTLRKGEGVVGWVVENGRPALVPDVSKEVRWQSKVDRETGFVTRSILCVPLIAQDMTIGAIELINKYPGTFDERDLLLLESIAAPLAIAIQNARLHQQVRERVAELTEVLAQVAHAKQEWEQTVDVIDAGIWLVDLECRILRANRTLAEWLGTTPNELIGSDCHRLKVCDAFSDYCPVLRKSAQVVQRGQVQISQLAGRTFRLNTYPMQSNGRLIGSVNVLQDITAEKLMIERYERESNSQ